MSVSIWQILLVAVLFMLLFGRGKVPQLMTDIAQGIKNFKAGMKDEETPAAPADTAAATPVLPDQRTQPHTSQPVSTKAE